MKKYKIKDSLGKEKLIQAESVTDVIKQTRMLIKDSIVIGTSNDVEFTYKKGAFYANGIKLEHDLVKDALVNDDLDTYRKSIKDAINALEKIDDKYNEQNADVVSSALKTAKNAIARAEINWKKWYGGK